MPEGPQGKALSKKELTELTDRLRWWIPAHEQDTLTTFQSLGLQNAHFPNALTSSLGAFKGRK